MKAGDKVRVIGPIEWLEHIGLHNRIDQIAILVDANPVMWDVCPGRGATNIFRIKFNNSQNCMFHHVWGPCMEAI